ncbi:reverse transcriptase domain-containing protein [Tanacetum coccineum]
MSTRSSHPSISSDVADSKTWFRALILDRKEQTPASARKKKRWNKVVNLWGEVILIKTVQPLTATYTMYKHSRVCVQAAAAQFQSSYILVIDLRWSQTKFDLLVFLLFRILMQIVKTISIEEITSIKTEETISTKVKIYHSGSSTKVVNQTVVSSRTCPQTTLLLSGSGNSSSVTLVTNPKEGFKKTRNPNPEPNVAPVIPPVPKASIPFPSRRNDERRKEKANDQIEKFYEIFRDLSFEISFTDALMLMPKFASTLKTLIGNKEKLSELARTPLNENCSAVILNKLPKKLGDPGRFLIPCEFFLSLPELTPTCMTLELADRSITEPIGIAEDVFVNVGKFQFPADFVVVDFEPDPRVPLILGRCFLKTSHALIDVYEGEITLRVGKEAITFNLDQTSKYTADYNHMTVNKIDVIDMACDEYSQEVLGFSNVIASGNPTPYFEPIVSTASPTLTPFGDSDFLLMEEADSFLALEDDPTSSEVDPTYQDPEGDILILEAILNSEPPPPLPNHEQYMPGGRKELKLCEAKTVEPSINEPPEVELKELPPHLEYAFLEGDDKLPVIIAKDLKDEEKAALLKVLKSHKRAIAWKLSDIKGVSPEFYICDPGHSPGVHSGSELALETIDTQALSVYNPRPRNGRLGTVNVKRTVRWKGKVFMWWIRVAHQGTVTIEKSRQKLESRRVKTLVADLYYSETCFGRKKLFVILNAGHSETPLVGSLCSWCLLQSIERSIGSQDGGLGSAYTASYVNGPLVRAIFYGLHWGTFGVELRRGSDDEWAV